MGTGTKMRIVKIGNSRGIRIPKLILDQAELGDEIELEVRGDHLIIRPVKSVRQGWNDQFKKMADRGDDKLLDSETISSTSWDKSEWKW